MSSVGISMHHVNEVRVKSYYPKNSNSIEISFRGGDGEIDITIYGLPRERAATIINALGDEKSIVYDVGGSIPLSEYLETKEVFEAMEEDHDGVP